MTSIDSDDEFETGHPLVPGEPLPARRARLPDPAYILADLLFQDALSTANLHPTPKSVEGLVFIIIVPGVSWMPLAEAVWRQRLGCREEPEDGYRTSWRPNSGWVSWCADTQPSEFAIEQANEAFSQAIPSGRTCVGIAADLSWLPRDLLLTSDHQLSVAPPTGELVAKVAATVTKTTVSVVLNDADALQVSPRLLRLAFRPARQTADDYLRKLESLIKQERVRKQPTRVTPRHAPTLDRLHGMPSAVEWGYRLAEDLKGVRAGLLTWGELDRGCLLSGPPGCGKTLFARALAETCGIPLVAGSYSQWLATGSAHQGDLLKAMRSTFASARAQAPCILFIDEIDSFPDRDTVSHRHKEWEVQVVNALLAEIDGVEVSEGVIVLGACNNPDRLDAALTRSGRLDRHIRIGLPEPDDLALILREHLGQELADADLRTVVLWASGMSGADCERVVREAKQRARIATRPLIVEDLEWVVSGKQRLDLSPEDLWVICVHEAGHAVIGLDLGLGERSSVSVGSDGMGALGRIKAASRKGCMLIQDVRERVMFYLAGRAAEEVLLGEPSSGAGGSEDSDLARATMLLVSSHTTLGLSQAMPPMWLGPVNSDTLPIVLGSHPVLARTVAAELTRAYDELLRMVDRRRAAILDVAEALRDRRALDGNEVRAIADRPSPGTPAQVAFEHPPTDSIHAGW